MVLGYSAHVRGGDKGMDPESGFLHEPEALSRTGEPRAGVTGGAAAAENG